MAGDGAWPFVSVIAPVYNAERTIGRLLTSLAALDYPNDRYEVLVVDNRSTDRTRQLVTGAGVRLLEERSVQSSYAARNAGVRASRGELLAFVDADCEFPPEWLARTVPAFREPAIGCVTCEITGPEPRTPLEAYLRQQRVLSPRRTLAHPFLPYAQTACALYRRQVFDRIGWFEPWVSAGDADFAWRMQRQTAYRIHFEPSVTILHHHRPTAWRYFKQRFKWAYGSVVLYKKYRAEMPYEGRKSWWEAKQLLLQVLRLPWGWLHARRDAAALARWQERYFETLTGLANRLGRIYGSLRHAVWYF
jgi:cellulose synthase/poly-beta-1,6-N-acetylglucosamine synthase-like glycosyltransferase